LRSSKKIAARFMGGLSFYICCLFIVSISRAGESRPEVASDEIVKPAEYFEAIHSRWPRHYRHIEAAINPKRNYVVLSLLEPSTPMDLRSAELFRRSFIARDLMGKQTIGHTMLAWQCQLKDGGGVRKGATALSGEGSGQIREMASNGWGLTSFVSTFTDGYLQTAENIELFLDRSKALGLRTYNIVIEVPQDDCLAAVRFLRRFVFSENEPMKNFGLAHDPESLTGGGCGSFGLAFLNRINVWPSQLMNSIWRDFRAPLKFVGWGLPILPNTAPFIPKELSNVSKPQNYVHLYDLQWQLWEDPNGPHASIRIVDPEMFILAVDTVIRKFLPQLSHENRAEYVNLFPGPRVVESATPDPTSFGRNGVPYTMYRRYFKIDRSFDVQAAQIVSIAEEWASTQINQQSRRVQMVEMGNSVALILSDSR
jgi:hypothetical protein